ncbi:hypothetical protein A5672_15925 [Mycobacterium alsense]|uniref:PPE family protein n=2 Tax=Mycobacterium alsense TaxID=324058 RepID=A0ABD6P4J1_9MYCO|nr:hypothetical protein A5672_15925 [Mycobacterium alsense]
MAFPPELHSALLSSGPGPGPLLAAAQTWTGLSVEYQTAAAELGAVLAGAQQVWEGPTAAAYVAAHGPYLDWLALAGMLSAEAAARHEAVAGAYAAALAAMPTLAELAANHAIHAVLVATNFFGVNTVPIAVNEADYARMWTQAATTMSTYQATTEAAQARGGAGGGGGGGNGGGGGGNGGGGGGGGGSGGFQLPTPAEIWAMIFGADGERFPRQGQPNWSPLEYLQNLPNFISGNEQALGYLQTNLPQVLTNPAQLPALLSYFVAWQTFRAVNWTLRTLRFIVQTAPLLLPAVLNLAATNLGGLAGLSGLAALGQPGGPVPVAAAPAVSPQLPSVAFMAAPALAPGPAPMPAATPAPAASATAPAAAPAAQVAGVEGFGYLVGGPGPGFGPTLGARISVEEPVPDSAAAAAVATAAARRDKARAARRLRTVIDRGYRYEYLEADDETVIAGGTGGLERRAQSGHGAGAMGFAGTLLRTGKEPAGLATMAGDAFGGGPELPMVPGTWSDEQ